MIVPTYVTAPPLLADNLVLKSLALSDTNVYTRRVIAALVAGDALFPVEAAGREGKRQRLDNGDTFHLQADDGRDYAVLARVRAVSFTMKGDMAAYTLTVGGHGESPPPF